MEYLIPAALVVLLISAFVTFVAFHSTRKGGPGEIDRNADDSGDASPGMGADEATGLGDTDQHSQEPSADQPGGDDGERSGGRFRRADGPVETDTRPRSERLADRGF